jgi:D-alanine-D-alanine ligase
MRICILNPSYERSVSDFKGLDPPCDPSPFAPEHAWDRVSVDKATAASQIVQLGRRGYDLFFQLCDGSWDEDRAGVEVVAALERLGLPFTGSGSRHFDPTRDAMKRVCHAWDVPTPEHALARTEGDLRALASWMRFPLIVKHPAGYGSIGMTRRARVTDVDALVLEGMAFVERFGEVLAERFVDGREFTVLVSEDAADPDRPHTYVPVECRFPPGETFKHFDLKWRDHADIGWAPVEDPVLAARLRDLTARIFLGFDGQGYARCDFRMGDSGVPEALEINLNCGVLYPPGEESSADHILANDPVGTAGFVRRVIDAGLARHRRARRAFAIRWRPGMGWGMVAARDLVAGEVVDRWEEREHVLVSRSHVERAWDARRRDWFGRYAWPLTDDVYVMWSSDPAQWTPIDHGCDPNAWLVGLDLVARRDIPAGARISMDYATFCGPLTTPFDCACGSPKCRGRVGPDDHRDPAFRALYGDHVSDYVRRGMTADRYR